MRRILIVGGGRSAMTLACALQQHDYDVTVMAPRYPDDVRTEVPSVTQFSMPRALAREQELELDWWSSRAPRIAGVRVGLYAPGAPPMVVHGRFSRGHAVSVDPRIKMADWLEAFQARQVVGALIRHGAAVCATVPISTGLAAQNHPTEQTQEDGQ